jgi:SAM-dependent methyltransferase
MTETSPPSAFLADQLERLRGVAERGAILDLACGLGRNALPVAQAGLPVIGVDRNRDSLDQLRAAAKQQQLAIDTIHADLESPSEIPIRSESCAAVLIFRYLHRPLTPAIQRILAPGGLLFYETFTIAQVELGYGPGSPAHLLSHGELPELFAELEILEHWEGVQTAHRPAAVGQLVAQKR